MSLPRIMVAPTGARRQRADHPALPLTVPEIAATAATCQRAGAGAIHLHVREDDGSHSLDTGRYREVMAAVTEAAPGMLQQVTTESAGIFSPAQQLACLQDLRPGRATVCIREMAPEPAIAARTYGFAAEAGIQIQHILFDASCLAQLQAWVADGTITEPLSVIAVLGAYAPARAGAPAELDGWPAALRDMTDDWMVCAFGPVEQSCLTRALALGGKARVGFENNLTAPDGTPWADNAAAVAALIAKA